MKILSKLFIFILFIEISFQKVYNAKHLCKQKFVTTNILANKYISTTDLMGKSSQYYFVLNTTVVVRVGGPGMAVHIGFHKTKNIESSKFYNELEIMYSMTYIKGQLHSGSTIQAIGGKCVLEKLLTRSRVSWFATYIILTEKKLVVYYESYKKPVISCDYYSTQEFFPNYINVYTQRKDQPTKFYYQCENFLRSLIPPVFNYKDKSRKNLLTVYDKEDTDILLNKNETKPTKAPKTTTKKPTTTTKVPTTTTKVPTTTTKVPTTPTKVPTTPAIVPTITTKNDEPELSTRQIEKAKLQISTEGPKDSNLEVSSSNIYFTVYTTERTTGNTDFVSLNEEYESSREESKSSTEESEFYKKEYKTESSNEESESSTEESKSSTEESKSSTEESELFNEESESSTEESESSTEESETSIEESSTEESESSTPESESSTEESSTEESESPTEKYGSSTGSSTAQSESFIEESKYSTEESESSSKDLETESSKSEYYFYSTKSTEF
uniref:Uncharacterized protein n=1 Tax=Megaselia scalaris TaxID=36166 RepID=T1GZH3_MEGSC